MLFRSTLFCMRSLIDAVKATNEGLSDGGCRKGPCVSVEFEIPLSPWQKVSPDPSVSIACVKV